MPLCQFKSQRLSQVNILNLDNKIEGGVGHASNADFTANEDNNDHISDS